MRTQHLSHHFGELSTLLDADEHDALVLLRTRFGTDLARTYQFWEQLTARMLDGVTTWAGCPWDVGAGPTRVEVKFSQEFTVRFRQGTRRVFRWVSLAREQADATVLFGIDPDDCVYLWVAPSWALGASATVTSPRDRVGDARSPLDRWHVPVDQLLPAVVRCHLHYDREHHAETRAATLAATLQTEVLF